MALTRIGRRSNQFTVSFSVARSGLLGDAKSTLLQQALRQFRAAGWAHTPDPAEAAATQGTAARPELAAIALFQDLPAEARDQLQSQLIRHELEPGQILFAQGDTEASLFIVTAGVLEVTRRIEGATSRVGRISAGDYIGEIGMLTGEPHAATVTALTPCTVFELRKEQVAPLLAAQPDMVHKFELSARRGQARLDRSVAASVGAAPMPPGQLLDRIRAFFHLPA